MATACQSEKSFDASGSFEAEEIIISSEASGVIRQFLIEEGQALSVGQFIGYIDSTQLFLKKMQLLAQIEAMQSRKPDIAVQLSALETQLTAAENELKRVENLLLSQAATQKQFDDINAQVQLLKNQIDAHRSTLEISYTSILKEVRPLQIQVEQLNDQLQKCVLTSPVEGNVLARYARANEMAATGKPLYKIADLSSMILRVYVSGKQLPGIKLNQTVSVFTDDGEGGFKEDIGIISWISDKAEFTPKTIQTKDERENLVYAVKVRLDNDGTYKIGMYGEIRFL